MFGKMRMRLERELREEREAHARDLEELEALRDKVEPERQELKKLQDACQKELRELEDQKRVLEEELFLRKKEAEEHIHKNVTALSDNYNYYLSQLKLLMDVLTKVSISVGGLFLIQEDIDTAELFRTMFSGELDPETFLRKEEETGPRTSRKETAP